MTTATIKNVNAALAIACIPLTLVRGKDYHYFIYDHAGKYETISVMAYRTSHLSIEQWIQEAVTAMDEIVTSSL